MSRFEVIGGNWTDLRRLPGLREVDLHMVGSDALVDRDASFEAKMEAVREHVLSELGKAYADTAVQYLLVVHGSSTSRRGRTSSRSVVRKLAVDKSVTPLIDRGRCLQHNTCFVFALRRTAQHCAGSANA